MGASLAEFRSAPLEGARVVSIAGELDLSNAPQLEHTIAEAVDGGQGAVVVDLSAVRYLDSTAVRSLIGHARGPVSLHLASPPSSRVRRSLELLGIGAVMPLHDTVEQAVRAAAPARARP